MITRSLAENDRADFTNSPTHPITNPSQANQAAASSSHNVTLELTEAYQSMPVSEKDHIRALSLLALAPERAHEALQFVTALDESGREQLSAFADSHHVVMRAFTVLHEAAASAGDERIAYWSLRAIEREKSRIGTAVTFLADICHQLESNGCPSW